MKKRVMFCLFFVLGVSFWARQAPAGQLDGDYLNKIRPERLITPSEPFAKPYAQGKLKILFIVPRNMAGREVVELWQRFEFEFDAVTTIWGTFALEDMYEARIKGSSISEKTDKLCEKLGRDWDVIILGKFSFMGLPLKCRYYILRKVSEGMGLISYGASLPPEITSRALASEPGKFFSGVPFANLPGYLENWKQVKTSSDLPEFMTKTYSLGKGRIIALQSARMEHDPWAYGLSLTPEFPYSLEEEIRYDYYLSLIAKAMLWASPVKSPRIILSQDSFEAVAIKQDQLPAKIESFYAAVDKPIEVILKQKIKNLFGDVLKIEDKKITLGAGRNSLPLALPKLPAGGHFLDFQLVTEKGVEQWGSVAVKIEPSSLTISRIKLSRPSYERTDTAKATVSLSASAPSDMKLKLTVFDVPYKRDIAIQEITINKGGEKLDVTFPLDRAVAIAHFLRVDLFSGDEVIDIKRERFFVRKHEPIGFPQIIWASVFDTYIGKIWGKQMLDAGFNVRLTILGGQPKIDPLHITMTDQLNLPYAAHIGSPGGILSDPKKTEETYTNPQWVNERIIKVIRDFHVKPYLALGLPTYYYSLGDENHYANHWQYGPTDLAYFREYVKKQYKGDIKLLNTEWKTNYNSFAEIEPININKPLTAEQIPIKHIQMSFAEHLYAKAHHDIAKGIKKFDPKARVGAEGSVMGNLEEVLSGLEMWGPYPNRFYNILMASVGARDLLRGNWWGGYTGARALGALPYWRQILSGGVNCNFYYASQGSEGMVSADLSYADFFEKDQLPVIREIASGIGQLIGEAEMKKAGVGVHYSIASEHANTVDSSFGAISGNRDTLMKLFDECAVPFLFYTPKQIKEGKLQKDKVKILFLPMSQSIGKEEADALKKWVEAGGTLVADVQIGTRNERCAPLDKGYLDDLFGISRTGPSRPKTASISALKAGGEISFDCEATILDESISAVAGMAMADKSAAGGIAGMKIENIPMNITRSAGKGKTIYLNFNLGKALTSTPDKAMPVSFIKTVLAESGVALDLVSPEGFSVYQFKKGDMELITSLREARRKQTGDAFIALSQPWWVYDVREGRSLGCMDKIPLKVSDKSERVFALLPEEAGRLVLETSSNAQLGELLKVQVLPGKEKNKPEGRLIRLSVFGPDGKEVMVLRRFAALAGPSADFAVPFAFNDQVGKWTLIATDVATGMQDKKIVEVRR